MTNKELILKEIKDINYAYNDCSKYATIKNLLDGIIEERERALPENDLNTIRSWLINNIFRNETIMFDVNIRRDDIDLVEVIASLYEILHRVVMQEPYEYMFHWANKVGSWCEDQLFINLIKEKMK